MNLEKLIYKIIKSKAFYNNIQKWYPKDHLRNINKQKFYKLTPSKINNGLCDVFAEVFSKLLNKLNIENTIESVYYFSPDSHVFTHIKDKFYDCEHPNGVEHFNQLNWFKRKVKEDEYQDFLNKKWNFNERNKTWYVIGY